MKKEEITKLVEDTENEIIAEFALELRKRDTELESLKTKLGMLQSENVRLKCANELTKLNHDLLLRKIDQN